MTLRDGAGIPKLRFVSRIFILLPVGARVWNNPASETHRDERAVVLNGENPHSSDFAIQCVEELAIAADGDVQVCGSAGIVATTVPASAVSVPLAPIANPEVDGWKCARLR